MKTVSGAGQGKWAVLAVLGMILGVAAPLLAATPKPIHWTLTAATHSPLPARKGARAVAHLRATIKPGWHLYALNQQPGGPVATRISVAEGQHWAVRGSVHEPTPITKHDPNFNIPTHFYNRAVNFTIPLEATGAAGRTVAVDVLFQTCNDELCLPPQTVEVTAPVRHEARGR